jgi:hypothetical protein
MNESRESGRGERIMGVVVLVTFVSVLLSLIFVARPVADGDGASDEASGGDAPTVPPVCDTSIIYRCFDPNVADYRTLIESGVPRDVAVSIIKWRESGKIYSIKEDVALVYNLSDSLYFALEPYIVIGEEFRLKPKVEHPREDDGDYVERRERHMLSVELEPFMLDTVSSGYLRGLGFSVREVIEVARTVTGHPIPAVVADRRAGDPAVLIAASDKARSILGWEPRKADLEQIIASAWQWHSRHPDGFTD